MADPRQRLDIVGIGTAFRNFNYEEEFRRLQRALDAGGGGGSGGDVSAAGIQIGASGTATSSVAGAYSVALPLGAVVKEDPVGFFTRTATQLSVKEAGWYVIQAAVLLSASLATGTSISVQIYKNGVAQPGTQIVEAAYFGQLSTAVALYLIPTDLIDVRAWSQLAVTTWKLGSLTVARAGGAKGDQGLTGAAGTPGAAGAQGPQGATGAAGTPTWRGDWSAAATYQQGQAVYFEGASYVAKGPLTGSSQSPSALPSQWDFLAKQGAQGVQGIPGGALGAASFSHYAPPSTAGVSLAAFTWKTLPLEGVSNIDPAGSFTVNADGSVTPTESGWYQVNAVGVVKSAYSDVLTIALDNGPNHTGTNYAWVGAPGSANQFPRVPIAAAVYLLGGSKIFVSANTPAGTTAYLQHLSIARVGGTQGEKGDPGTFQYGYQQYYPGVIVNVPATGWKSIPIGMVGGQTIEPAGAFTKNADGSITVVNEGWYQVNTTVSSDIGEVIRVSIGTAPDSEGALGVMFGDSGYADLSVGAKLVAGTKLYVNVRPQGDGGNCQVDTFSVLRTGAGATGATGAQGLPGPTGPQGVGGGGGALTYDFTLDTDGWPGDGELQFNAEQWSATELSASTLTSDGKSVEPVWWKWPEGSRLVIQGREPDRYAIVVMTDDNESTTRAIEVIDGAEDLIAEPVEIYFVPPEAGAGGGGGGHIVQDEGTTLTQRSKINFTGTGVVATDDAVNDATRVDIGTLGAAAACWDSGAGVAVGAGTYTILPAGTAQGQNTPIEFVRNGDGTITVATAGWYDITTNPQFNVASGVTTVEWRLCVSYDGSVPNQASYVAVSTFGYPTSTYPSATVATTRYLPAGTRIALYGYAGLASTQSCGRFSISRVGGPKGDTGPPGGTMGAVVAKALRLADFNVNNAVPGTTVMPFDTVAYESTPGLINMGDSTITIPETGYYMATAQWFTGAAITTGGTLIDVLIATTNGGRVAEKRVATNALTALTDVTAQFYAVAGEKVWVQLGQNTGATKASGATTAVVANYLAISRLGGPKGDTGGNATVPVDPWHVVGSGGGEPAFTSPWTTSGPATYGGLRFKKDPLGRVFIQGSIGGGTTGTSVFTLPAGYRPSFTQILSNVQSGAAAGTYVTIAPAGTVTPTFTTGPLFIEVHFDTETVTQMPTGPAGPQGPVGPPGSEYACSAPAAASTPASNPGAYTLLPFGTPFTTATGTTDEFERVASDGSCLVKQAGWYRVDAFCNALNLLTTTALFRLNLGLNNTTPNTYVAIDSAKTPYAVCTMSWTGYLAANTRLGVSTYHDDAAARVIYVAALGISRVGAGPQGLQGNAGNTPETWRLVGGAGNPVLGTGWTNLGGADAPAAFRKYPDGTIRLRGTVAGTIAANGTVIFTLPMGYRPAYRVRTTAQNDQNAATPSAGQVNVTIGGEVYGYAKAGSAVPYLSLDQVTFSID